MENYDINIKEGITIHTINNNKFKTNLIAIMLTTELNRENVTKNALIPVVLRRGSKNMPTQEEINKNLEEMYGASFDCGLDKTGDNQVLKFYLETINDEFLPQNNENILKTSIEKALDIVFNPYLENESFKKQYVEQEKENLKQRIEAKKDNKAKYAMDRCIEEMYKNESYGLYKFGYIEDLQNIDSENLYNYYKQLINNCKIDIYISGIIKDDIKNIIINNENIQKLQQRNAKYNVPKIQNNTKEQENIITESMEVNQGKLVIGLDINIDNEDKKYDVMLYNSILGGSANSKLFQNVREKASLAYTASSSYLRYKNNIFINCGIEIENYEKALKIIKEQIEDIKNGKFTDEEIENSKKGIISAIKTIDDEQDTEITYFFGQELTENKKSLEEYIKRVEIIKREDILDIANKTTINTIYFLKN